MKKKLQCIKGDFRKSKYLVTQCSNNLGIWVGSGGDVFGINGPLS